MAGTDAKARPSPSPAMAKLRIVDVDVHPRLNALSQLYPYMSESWRKRIGVKPISTAGAPETAANVFSMPKRWYYHPHGAERPDAIPPGGGRPGSDLDTLRSQHLDAYGIDYGILISGDLFGIGGCADADMAAALVSASNDWILEEWVSRDPRLKLSIQVGANDPQLAAKEIGRLGGHREVVQVQLSQRDMLAGNRYFYPIFEAAAHYGLPVAMHGGGESAGVNTPMSPVGIPSYFIEMHTGMTTIAQAHVISLISEGVLERFPSLRFVFQEMGYAWLPSVMWRLDKEWRSLRSEVPWLKRPPSEYITDHIRLTSQPIEEPPSAAQHLQLLEMMQAEKTLLFASDYPHWDFDNPRHVLQEAPEPMRRRIFSESAFEIYNLEK